jgi:hypothetical protein
MKKERKRYMKPGKWYRPVMKGFRLGCCKCGVLHRVDFKIEKDGIAFRMWETKR